MPNGQDPKQTIDPVIQAGTTLMGTAAPPPERARALNVGRGVSGALSIFGGVLANELNPVKGPPHPAAATVQNVWTQMGQDIYNDLENRWYREEEKVFDDMYVQSYKQASRDIASRLKSTMSNAAMGIFTQPDGTQIQINPASEKGMRLREDALQTALSESTQLDKQLFEDAAKKFGANPLVTARIQNLIMGKTKAAAERFQPTAALSGEEQYAKIAAARAQARATERAGVKRTAADFGIMTPREVIAEKGGIKQAFDFWTAAPTGLTYIDKYRRDRRAHVHAEERAIARTRKEPVDEDIIAERAAARDDEITRLATGDMIRATDPELANDLMKNPRFERYFVNIPHKDVKEAIFADEMERAREMIGIKIAELGGDVEAAARWMEEHWIATQVDVYKNRYNDPQFLHELRLQILKIITRARAKKGKEMPIVELFREARKAGHEAAPRRGVF